MARSANPLQRDQVAVQARDTGDRYARPTTNSALSLASSLKELEPTLQATLQGVAETESAKAKAKARRDALTTNGAKLGDAVREGKIQATQNPWYMEAYAKEGAAIRGTRALSELQTASASWETRNDPKAFEKQWREEVGKLAENFSSKDEIEGFLPAQAQATQQALASNISQNSQRIQAERVENVSSLAAHAIANAAGASGGKLSGEALLGAVRDSYEMWHGTGGSEAEWHSILTKAVTTASYSTSNPGLLDALKAVGVDNTVVLDGEFGDGADPETPPSEATSTHHLAGTALPPAHAVPVQGFKLTSKFGEKRSYETHPGVDLAVPEGTNVSAPGAGKVIAAGTKGKLGNFITIDHGNGLVSSYGHLSSLNVAVGDTVAPGQLIALSGGKKGSPGAGNSTGPHLHWATRQNGSLVNPMSVRFPQGEQMAEGGAGGSAVLAAAASVAAPAAEAVKASPPVARGASLYDVAGTADTVESDRFRITQAQTASITRRAQAIKADREVRGMAGSDYLISTHGESLYSGQYDPAKLRAELRTQGFKEPEIAVAMNNLRDLTSDSASLANNRVALNTANPQGAVAVMKIFARAQKDGYSEALEQEAAQKVLRGELSQDDATRIISTAISTTQRLESESRQDRKEATAELKASGAVYNAASLKFKAQQLASQAVQGRLIQTGKMTDPKEQARYKQLVQTAMEAHLARHPGDWAGAEEAGGRVVLSFLTRLSQPPPLLRKPTGPAKPASNANPNR